MIQELPGWTGWHRSETSLYRCQSQHVIWGWKMQVVGRDTQSPPLLLGVAATVILSLCLTSGPSFSCVKSSVHTFNKIRYWAGYYRLSWWLRGKESACQYWRHGFDPWVGKIPWRRKISTHSSTLAWEISWKDEPGRLQFMGSQSIERDLVTKQQTAAC